MTDEVREFRVDVPEEVLADLRRRLADARYPEQIPGTGWEYGTELGKLKELVAYWRDKFDWRAQEARLNAFPQFETEIDGQRIHFIHARSRHENAMPLLISHGWPGSVVEFLKVIEPLRDPEAHGGRAEDAFHVICPSLPGYGFSGPTDERQWDLQRMADAFAALMARLGYTRYGAQGGDWGALITTQIGLRDAEHLSGIHVNMPVALPPAGADPQEGLSDAEKADLADYQLFDLNETGYQKIQGSKPQTLGFALMDSPTGLAAWILEKFHTWSDCGGDVESVYTLDELLANITVYWVTGTITSSTRLYYEVTKGGRVGFIGNKVQVPTGVARFPKEIMRFPRKWVENHYNVTHWTDMPRGGHFAAMEQPALFVEDGELVGLRPDREHPVTRGFSCHKGMASLDIHRDPDRLDHPKKRRGDAFERIHWDDAIQEIAAKIRSLQAEHGVNSVAFYLGNPLAFNALAGPAIGSTIVQLRTRRVFGSGTQDCSNKFAAGEAVFGSSTVHPIPDIDHTHHLLVFGSNPRVSRMSFLSIVDPIRKLRAAVKRGAVVRYVNPRRIESAAADGGEVVLIRPDTDVYLMAAMLCALERTGRFNEDVLERHASHVEGLREFVRRYPPERVAGFTGIAAADIERMAFEFSDAESAAVYMSTGINMGRQGTLAYWLLFMLCLVTGNLDRRGGNLYSLGFYPAAKAGRIDPERAFFDSPYGRIRRIRGSLPGNLLPDMIEDPEDPIRALVVVAGNPVLSVGGEERMRRALAGLELLVSVDLYQNATGELAHYLLPTTDMLERPDINICGLGMQHQPFVQYTDRVVAPRAERREEWWIFARLEQELGLKSALDAGPEPPVFLRVDHMLARTGLSVEKLMAAPHQTAVLPEVEPGRFFSDWIQTRDKRVDCCPPLFAEALERAEAICVELESEPPDALKLITRRDDTMHNSWYQNVDRWRRARRGGNRLYMHPDDAAARGLADGARVRVRSAAGAIEIAIETDESLMRGVVAITHGWGNQRTSGMRVAQRTPGVNGNQLLPTGPGSFEPLSNQAFMTGIPVEVESL